MIELTIKEIVGSGYGNAKRVWPWIVGIALTEGMLSGANAWLARVVEFDITLFSFVSGMALQWMGVIVLLTVLHGDKRPNSIVGLLLVMILRGTLLMLSVLMCFVPAVIIYAFWAVAEIYAYRGHGLRSFGTAYRQTYGSRINILFAHILLFLSVGVVGVFFSFARIQVLEMDNVPVFILFTVIGATVNVLTWTFASCMQFGAVERIEGEKLNHEVVEVFS